MDPFSFWALPYFAVGDHVCEVLPAVAVAKQRHDVRICGAGHLIWLIDGIQVRNERNGNPVVSSDVVIAADDDPGFSRQATTEAGRSFSADAR